MPPSDTSTFVPRPRSLTLSGIAAAALAVIEREGVAEMSMRSVARELGVGTMSLYRYVEGRNEIEGLVIGLILDSVDTDLTPGAPWEEQVATLVGRVSPTPPGAPGASHPMWSSTAAWPRCSTASAPGNPR